MRRQVIVVGLIGTAVAALFAARMLVVQEWNPSVTIRFGEVFTEQNAYAEDLLGAIVVAPQAGHDGKFFFSQAMDPFYLVADVHAVYLDRPSYRAQRMLYPTLASLGGIVSAPAAAWGLIIVNVIAMGVGTAFTALVALEMGLSRWFGLAFLFNPGLLVVVMLDGAGIVATAALMAGVYYVLRENLGAAALALTFASLARETMLIGVLGLALFWYYRHRKLPWPMASPLLAVGAWWLYVHWRLDEALTQDTQALGLPFVGLVEAFQGWQETPGFQIDLLVGSILLVASIWVLIRSPLNPTALGWSVAGFFVLGAMLSEPIWSKYFDSSRALAPVFTASILLIPALIKQKREEAADQERAVI